MSHYVSCRSLCYIGKHTRQSRAKLGISLRVVLVRQSNWTNKGKVQLVPKKYDWCDYKFDPNRVGPL